MIIVPRRNLYLPERKWGKRKFQRGIIAATAVYGEVAEPAVLNLAGETATDVGVNRTARATMVVRADGTMDRIQNLSIVQVDTAADWIRPETAAPDDYEARYTGLTGDPLDSSTSKAVNIWHVLSTSDYFFEQSADQGTNDDNDSTFTIEIRKGSSGGALVTGTYRCHATNITL